MTRLDAMALVVQLLVPLLLLARVAFGRHRSGLALSMEAAMVALYLWAVARGGFWLALPWTTPLILSGLLLAATVLAVGRLRARKAPVPGRCGVWGLGVRGLLLASVAGVLLFVASGARPLPKTPVELAFPLADGAYLVAGGGSNSWVNPHLMTLTRERFLPYRGQSYGVDLVKLGGWGSRRSGGLVRDLTDYAIFGEAIRAPCGGPVVRAGDSASGTEGRFAALVGSHVILSCGRAWIVMAHMQPGSVRVARGDTVEAGTILGLVGNSGKSHEPHLHIHAQTPGSVAAPLSGAPLPLTFNGRHLVRNHRISVEKAHQLQQASRFDPDHASEPEQ